MVEFTKKCRFIRDTKMYKKILSAVNEHLNLEISARYALSMARVCGAKFYLCFIASKGMTRSSIDRAEEAMKRLFYGDYSATKTPRH